MLGQIGDNWLKTGSNRNNVSCHFGPFFHCGLRQSLNHENLSISFLPPNFFLFEPAKSAVHKDASVVNTTEKLLVYGFKMRPPSFGLRHPISEIKGAPRTGMCYESHICSFN